MAVRYISRSRELWVLLLIRRETSLGEWSSYSASLGVGYFDGRAPMILVRADAPGSAQAIITVLGVVSLRHANGSIIRRCAQRKKYSHYTLKASKRVGKLRCEDKVFTHYLL